MPIVEIVCVLKPEHPATLLKGEHFLEIYERFCSSQNILMQSEIIQDGVLFFFKSLADLEKALEMFANYPLKKVVNYKPATELERWEMKFINNSSEPTENLLKLAAERLQTFLGQFGRVEITPDRLYVYLPRNFKFDKYIPGNHQ